MDYRNTPKTRLVLVMSTITVCSDSALLNIIGELDSIEEIRQKEVEEVFWHILSTYMYVYTHHKWG